jgi:hypothetical protein
MRLPPDRMEYAEQKRKKGLELFLIKKTSEASSFLAPELFLRATLARSLVNES